MVSKQSGKVLDQYDDGEYVICTLMNQMLAGDVVYLIEELAQDIIDSVDKDTMYVDRLINNIDVTGIGYDCDGNYLIFENPSDSEHTFRMMLRATSLPNLDYDGFSIVKYTRDNSVEPCAISFGTKIPDALVALRYLVERHYVRNIKNKH